MYLLMLVAAVLLVALYSVHPVRHGPFLGVDGMPATLRGRFIYFGFGVLIGIAMFLLIR